MNRPSSEVETSTSGERGIPFNVRLPESLSFIGIIDEQWNQLKRQVENIGPSENLWFLVCSVSLTLGISFLISVTQLGTVEPWVRTSFWMATAAGLVGAVLCAIAGWQTRGRRKDDIKAVLNYMDEIEQTYRE